MFTGIIETTTTIDHLENEALRLRCPWNTNEITLGQSIAIDGCCLTVTHIENNILTFHLSTETLSKTIFSTKKTGDVVNVERALKFGDRLDGHLVSGHVDAVVKMVGLEPHADGLSQKITLEIPRAFQTWIAPKGSITLDGVSLTVNDVNERTFSVTIIPHTMEVTTWKHKRPGDAFNVEFDMLAKYVERILQFRNQPSPKGNDHAVY